MLAGEHIHTIDSKNRVSMPAKFRALLGKKVYITLGLDGCLFMFSVSEWKAMSEKIAQTSFLNSDSRSFNRYFLGQAEEIEIDTLGRVLIPQNLREKIGLKDKVAFIGMSTRVELWENDKWQIYKGSVEKQADTLAEKLSNLGIL